MPPADVTGPAIDPNELIISVLRRDKPPEPPPPAELPLVVVMGALDRTQVEHSPVLKASPTSTRSSTSSPGRISGTLPAVLSTSTGCRTTGGPAGLSAPLADMLDSA